MRISARRTTFPPGAIELAASSAGFREDLLRRDVANAAESLTYARTEHAVSGEGGPPRAIAVGLLFCRHGWRVHESPISQKTKRYPCMPKMQEQFSAGV